MKSSTKKTNDNLYKLDVETVNKLGRPRKFATPRAIAVLFNEYVDLMTANPLKEGVAFHFQGSVTEHDLPKLRPLTLEGFCNYADMTLDTFSNYEKLPTSDAKAADFLGVCTRIREIIFTQQYEGAAAGLLNPAIVAAKLHIAQINKNLNANLTDTGEINAENVKKVSDLLEEKY